MNVLVIEDGADATASLQDLLEFEGHGVVAVRTAREAVEQADWSEVEAVLADGVSADGDGLLPGLRTACPNTPVFVITGHRDLAAALTALGGRAAGGRTRRINPAVLRASLARVAGLRTAEQQVVQAARLAAVGELAASVAHELNNALATATLRLEGLVARTPRDDPRWHALEVVDQEVERMATLVSNLLEFTRAGRGQVSTVDVCDEVTKTIDLTDHHLSRKGVRAVADFAPDVPLLQADRQHVRQVLLNLLTNAADAMPNGGRVTIRVRPAELADQPAAVVEVSDTGTGIKAEHLSRIFDPFFTTKEEGKGTGLGLAICKRIVDQHHGTLEVESTVGVGTTFRVTLPVRAANVGPSPARAQPAMV
ncbi:MAG TPA: ATP-binding protein [Gemmataceae bacterium]|nr:ATP-binding protein [Gemmataceae bacterium]